MLLAELRSAWPRTDLRARTRLASAIGLRLRFY